MSEPTGDASPIASPQPTSKIPPRFLLYLICSLVVLIIFAYIFLTSTGPGISTILSPSQASIANGLLSRIASGFNSTTESSLTYTGTAHISLNSSTDTYPFTITYVKYHGNSMLNINIAGNQTGAVATLLGMQGSNDTIYEINGTSYVCSNGIPDFSFANGSADRICRRDVPLAPITGAVGLPIRQLQALLNIPASSGTSQTPQSSFYISNVKSATSSLNGQQCNETSGDFSGELNESQGAFLGQLLFAGSNHSFFGYELLKVSGSFSLCVSSGNVPLDINFSLSKAAVEGVRFSPIPKTYPQQYAQTVVNSTPLSASLWLSVSLQSASPSASPIAMQQPNSTCSYLSSSFLQFLQCSHPAIYSNGTLLLLTHARGLGYTSKVACSENPSYTNSSSSQSVPLHIFYNVSGRLNSSTTIFSIPCYDYNGNKITNLSAGSSFTGYIYELITQTGYTLVVPAGIVNLKAGEVPAVYESVIVSANQKNELAAENYSYWPHYVGKASGLTGSSGSVFGAYTATLANVSGNVLSIGFPSGAKQMFIVFSTSKPNVSSSGSWQTPDKYVAYYYGSGSNATFTNFNYSRFYISIFSSDIAGSPSFSITTNGQQQKVTKVLNGIPDTGTVSSVQLTDNQVIDSMNCTTLTNTNIGQSSITMGHSICFSSTSVNATSISS
jgi:hypothetical protein